MKMHMGMCLAVTLAAAACGGGGGKDAGTGPYGTTPGSGTPTSGTPPASNTITATTSNTFNPSALTVARGTTVTFVFEAVTHNVTFAGGSGVPSNVPDSYSTSVQRQFNTAGTFGFTCTIHGSYMAGQVTVQ